MKGFTTRALHGRFSRADAHGALRMPIYQNVSFEFDNARDLELAFQGKKPGHAYSRISNPTVEAFELKVRALADAVGVLAVSSGMAAISSLFMAIAEAGTNIVTSRFLFGNSLSFLQKTLGAWGLETRFVDMENPAEVEKAIDSRTRAIFLEIITNPQLQVADIGALARVARRRRVPLVVDTTLTTPFLFKAKDFGVAVEVISSTKYISGGATSVGGLIIDLGNFNWQQNPKLQPEATQSGPFALLMKLRQEVYRNLGCCMTPETAYLQSLGLETLALRITRSCHNALEIARFLKNHPAVRSVNYPGLEDSAYFNLAKKQFNNLFGGLLTFNLKNRQACFRLMDNLKLIRRSTNLNDNKSLIIHPASTIFCEYSEEEKSAMRIPENMVRLSVGIEDIEDLLDDLNEGLKGL